MADRSKPSCAQPICRHLYEDHREADPVSNDRPCTRCDCSSFVSRRRMLGRRILTAVFSQRDPSRGPPPSTPSF
jgi:hypothetical protein